MIENVDLIPEEINDNRKRLFDQSWQWLLQNVPVPMRDRWVVFEAGQGLYGWSDLYKKYFRKVIGADIKDCSAYHPGVESIIADLCKEIPLPDESVDFVVSHSVLEHLNDLDKALNELDRILKKGKWAYLTVSPLYFSAKGSHSKTPDPVDNWEHLDPKSPLYMLTESVEPGPQYLNQLTLSRMLEAVGRLPWSIQQVKIQIDERPLPSFLMNSKINETDLRTKGFKILALKEWHRK